jgi:hypothetical protein
MTTLRIPLPVLLLTSLSFAIPWPIAPTNQTHSLFHSYGDYHRPWDDTTEANFHYGIDIADPNPLGSEYEPVRCVEAGVVKKVQEPEALGWFAIIEDNGTPSIDGDGWIYEHIQGLPPAKNNSILPRPCRLDQAFGIGDIIGYIAHVYQPVSPYGRILDHLHLMRADEPQNGWNYWESSMPAALNPLFYLDPAPTTANGFDWSWLCDASLNPTLPNPGYMFFILPQYEALGTGGDSWLKWADSAACQTEANGVDFMSLKGSVDLFLYFNVKGEGYTGGTPVRKSMPQRLEWWIERKLADGTWTTLMNDGEEYRRYLFDFGDIELGGSDDTDEYKQLYFRFSPGNMGITDGGYLCCLTNVNDNQAFNGVSNIDEKCWDTSVNLAGTGAAVSNDDALFPDGEYRIRWEASAFDGTTTGEVVSPAGVSSGNSIELAVCNFGGFVNSATVSAPATVFWDAGWETVETTDGYELQFVVNTDESTYPTGQTIDIEIHFSTSMDPNCPTPPAFIRLENEYGYQPPISGGSWSSTRVVNDTWTGTAVLPTVMLPGRATLLVSWQDISGEWLEDPANPGVPFMDNYHGVDIAFGVEDGWPVAVHDEVLGSPKLADIDQDGDLDVIIQSADGWVDVLDDDGSSMSGWPVSGGWSSGNPDVWASPAIINLSGISSSAPEILAVHPYGCNGFMATGSAISGWSGILPSIFRWNAMCSPVAGNFNGTGENEYVLGRQHAQNVINDISLLTRENDGTPFWLTAWGEDESVSSTPSLADVDNDGGLEVIAASDYTSFQRDNTYGTVYCLDADNNGTEKWSTYVGGDLIFGAVTTANLDSDNYLEIVVGASQNSNSIKVLDGNTGTIQYTISTDGQIYAGASIADVDGDGDNDIVVSSSGGMLYCWDGPTGNNLSGFPVNLGTWTDDGVSIGDVDRDEMLELVIAGKDGKLHVINHDGSSTGGFPITVSGNALSGQPALGDIDGDGRLEIVFGEAGNSVVHCYEMADNSAYTYLPWPQFQHDAQNTGYFPSDITAPAPPTNFTGDGELVGNTFTVDLTWTLSVNDPSYTPNPVPPADVISYNIYRKIAPRPIELVATVTAGTSGYTDVITFTSFPYPSAVAYYASAWDGVNESAFTPVIKVLTGNKVNIASGCPVMEISHSAGVQTSQGLTSAGIGTGSSLSGSRQRNNCRVLTDGEYDEVYFPSGSSDCVAIDLGDVFTITGAVVFSRDLSLTESVADDSSVLMSGTQIDDCVAYELSVDGRTFSRTDSGNARYIRVYGASGATEIEVYGETSSATSALVEIQRNASEGYRITAVAGSYLTVTVFDLSGRTVWNSTSSSGEILWNRCTSSGNTVPSGIYLLMVESEDMETYTAKVIVR